MTQRQANLHAVSVCASFSIAMLGLTHEIVGATLYPWAPEWFGLFAWHSMGIVGILLGLACLGSIFGGFNIPTVSIGIVFGLGGLATIVLLAVKVQQFHFFATWLTIAGFSLAFAQNRLRQEPQA